MEDCEEILKLWDTVVNSRSLELSVSTPSAAALGPWCRDLCVNRGTPVGSWGQWQSGLRPPASKPNALG